MYKFYSHIIRFILTYWISLRTRVFLGTGDMAINKKDDGNHILVGNIFSIHLRKASKQGRVKVVCSSHYLVKEGLSEGLICECQIKWNKGESHMNVWWNISQNVTCNFFELFQFYFEIRINSIKSTYWACTSCLVSELGCWLTGKYEIWPWPPSLQTPWKLRTIHIKVSNDKTLFFIIYLVPIKWHRF